MIIEHDPNVKLVIYQGKVQHRFLHLLDPLSTFYLKKYSLRLQIITNTAFIVTINESMTLVCELLMIQKIYNLLLLQFDGIVTCRIRFLFAFNIFQSILVLSHFLCSIHVSNVCIYQSNQSTQILTIHLHKYYQKFLNECEIWKFCSKT